MYDKNQVPHDAFSAVAMHCDHFLFRASVTCHYSEPTYQGIGQQQELQDDYLNQIDRTLDVIKQGAQVIK